MYAFPFWFDSNSIDCDSIMRYTLYSRSSSSSYSLSFPLYQS